MTPAKSQARQAVPPDAELRLAHLAPLAGFTSIIMLAAVALPVLVEPLSDDPGFLTCHGNALTISSAALAALIAIVMPLWGQKGTLRRFQRENYRHAMRDRLIEAAVVPITALPFLLAAAIFAQQPLGRVAELLIGLIGVVILAAAWRAVLVGGVRLLRQAAVLDVLLTSLAPLIMGYLLLEGMGVNIGCWWRISPPAIAADLATQGLRLGSAAFWIGMVIYPIIAAAMILLLPRMMPQTADQQPPSATPAPF